VKSQSSFVLRSSVLYSEVVESHRYPIRDTWSQIIAVVYHRALVIRSACVNTIGYCTSHWMRWVVSRHSQRSVSAAGPDGRCFDPTHARRPFSCERHSHAIPSTASYSQRLHSRRRRRLTDSTIYSAGVSGTCPDNVNVAVELAVNPRRDGRKRR